MRAIDLIEVQSAPLPRSELSSFLKNPRQVDAFERLQDDNGLVVTSINSLIERTDEMLTAPIVTYSPSLTFGDSRRLVSGTAISVTISDAEVAVSLDDTAVTAGSYGSPSETIAFSVDQQGRLTAAEAYDLNTDNITEGASNLFYTDSRARAALAGGDGIDYDDGTGEISLEPSGVSAGTYLSPTSITVDEYGRVTAIS